MWRYRGKWASSGKIVGTSLANLEANKSFQSELQSGAAEIVRGAGESDEV